jgi:predicted nucleotidyltransferase
MIDPDPLAFELPPERGTEILRVEVGSTLHGTGLPGGEDLDLMAVAVPSIDNAAGLERRWETFTRRTQPEGAKSGPGDTDLTVYTIQKFLRLATDGNPTVLLILFAPRSHVHFTTSFGDELRARAPAWVASKRAGDRYRGYLDGQRRRFLGEKARHGRTRPDLIEEHGYDTKYAMHMIRLGYQGIEFLSTGRLTLPMAGDEAELCRSIRRGEWTRDAVNAHVAEVDARLVDAIERSPLADEPDRAAAAAWCIDTCRRVWLG